MTLLMILNTILVLALALLPCAIAMYLSRHDNGDWL